MQKWHKVKIILSENFFKHFFKKRKGTIYHQSLILQPLLENNINKKMGTSCPNPKSICKSFAKIVQKNCEKNCVKFLQKIV